MLINIKKIAFYGRKRLFGVWCFNIEFLINKTNNGSKSLDEASDYMYPTSGYLASGYLRFNRTVSVMNLYQI